LMFGIKSSRIMKNRQLWQCSWTLCFWARNMLLGRWVAHNTTTEPPNNSFLTLFTFEILLVENPKNHANQGVGTPEKLLSLTM
jgi:hypothetical protein